MARNVLASWAGYAVLIAAGFIMPRFIDRHIGQTALGVWDFGWSLVTYFGLAQVGVGSATNRYVAAHRSAGAAQNINGTVSAVMCVQLTATIVVIALTMLAAWRVPTLLSHRLSDFTSEARWVVLLLGLTIAAQLPLDACSGIITGFHRWGLYSAVNTAGHASTIVMMMLALKLGGGLRSLALASFLGTLFTEVARVLVAYRIYPDLRLNPFRARRVEIQQLLMFGAKTVMNSISSVLLYQTSSLLVIAFLGPAALAVYARPLALIRHVQTLVNKFAFVLTPVAGALGASGDRGEIRALLVRSTRYGMYMTIPLLLPLLIFGDTIMRSWMGPNYEETLVLTILTLSHLLPVAQQSIVRILVGLNLHGRIALANLLSAACAVVLGFLSLEVFHLGLVGAASSIAIPLVVASGIYVPLYACRRAGLGLSHFLVTAYRGPLLAAILYLFCLAVTRILVGGSSVLALVGGMAVGTLALVPIYWVFVLPTGIKTALRSILGGLWAWPSLGPS